MFDDINLNREAVYVHHIAIVEIYFCHAISDLCVNSWACVADCDSQSRHVCELSLRASRPRHAIHTDSDSLSD